MLKDAAHYETRYNNRAAVPEFQSHFERWARASADARRELDVELDVPYGDDRMETMDIFRPRGDTRALQEATVSWTSHGGPVPVGGRGRQNTVGAGLRELLSRAARSSAGPG